MVVPGNGERLSSYIYSSILPPSYYDDYYNKTAMIIEWMNNEFIPIALEIWIRMDVPTWDIYSNTFITCINDLIQSIQSSSILLYMTIKPFLVLGLVIGQVIYMILEFLFRHLVLDHGYNSLKKSSIQCYKGLLWFIQFQKSLSYKEILGEIGIIITIIALYYLRKWIQRQTYVTRLTKYMRTKKRRIQKYYTQTVTRIAQVSLVLAMLTPHVIFGVGWVGLKCMFPALMKWLAMETYATALISVWYPFISTISWIHYYQSGLYHKDQEEHQQQPSSSSPSPKRKKKIIRSPKKVKPTTSNNDDNNNNVPSYMKPTALQQSRQRKPVTNTTTAANKRSTLRVATSPTATGRRGKRTSLSSPVTPTPTPKDSFSFSFTTSEILMQDDSRNVEMDPYEYWVRYWIIYGCSQAVGTMLCLTPIVGRIVTRYAFVQTLTAEFKLLFFVWIFGMEYILNAAIQSAKNNSLNTPSTSPSTSPSSKKINDIKAVYEKVAAATPVTRKKPQNPNYYTLVMHRALPLPFLVRCISPVLGEIESIVAETVKKSTWDVYVVSKAKSILDVFTMMKMISKEWNEWLIHVLEESRCLVVPSITLFMPSFMTQFGVTYVQFVVPSSKSIRSMKDLIRLKKQRRKMGLNTNTVDKDLLLLQLQYWVLNCFITGFVCWFASILWWIPFSTHIIYIIWCQLSFPKTIVVWYDVIESELMAFGILHDYKEEENGTSSGDNPNDATTTTNTTAIESKRISQTRTVRLLKVIAQSIPSAASYESDNDDHNDEEHDDDDDDDDEEVIVFEKEEVVEVAQKTKSNKVQKTKPNKEEVVVKKEEDDDEVKTNKNDENEKNEEDDDENDEEKLLSNDAKDDKKVSMDDGNKDDKKNSIVDEEESTTKKSTNKDEKKEILQQEEQGLFSLLDNEKDIDYLASNSDGDDKGESKEEQQQQQLFLLLEEQDQKEKYLDISSDGSESNGSKENKVAKIRPSSQEVESSEEDTINKKGGTRARIPRQTPPSSSLYNTNKNGESVAAKAATIDNNSKKKAVVEDENVLQPIRRSTRSRRRPQTLNS